MINDVIFKFRRDTASNWSIKNPVLLDGEPGVEYDDNDPGNASRLKIGDGFTAWNALDYCESAPSGGGPLTDAQIAAYLSATNTQSHAAVVGTIASETDPDVSLILQFENALA